MIIIPSLGRGGAEQFSIELTRSLMKYSVDVQLVVLTDQRQDIDVYNLPVILIGKSKTRSSILNLIKLRIRSRDDVWLSTGLQANIICLIVSMITFVNS